VYLRSPSGALIELAWSHEAGSRSTRAPTSSGTHLASRRTGRAGAARSRRSRRSTRSRRWSSPDAVARFIVYGAGAIGGVIGARLHQHGHEVALIGARAHREAIARDGLRVESPSGVTVHRVDVVADPAELAPSKDDVVLITVKSQDTVAVLDRLSAVGGADSPWRACRTGVANENAALRLFAAPTRRRDAAGDATLIPGVVHRALGTTRRLARRRPPIPPVSTRRRSGSPAAFGSSGFSSARAAGHLALEIREGLLPKHGQLGAGAGSGSPRGRRVLRRSRAEAVAVARRRRDDYVPDDEYDAHHGAIVNVQGNPRTLGSSWQSLARGSSQIEGDYLNGENRPARPPATTSRRP